MMKFSFLLLASLLIGLYILVKYQRQAEVDFLNPIRSAEEDEIDLNALFADERPLNLTRQYSGYVRGQADSEEPNNFLHYWLVESESDPANDPLVLYIDGGPGSSNVFRYVIIGPMTLGKDPLLKPNSNSINLKVNLILMDFPSAVGYSYSRDGVFLNLTNEYISRQIYYGLKGFLKKFPRFKQNPLFLITLSYGSVLASSLAKFLIPDREINFQGVAFGSGIYNENINLESLVPFGYYHDLVGTKSLSKISNDCCAGNRPGSLRNCAHFYDAEMPTDCAKSFKFLDIVLNEFWLVRDDYHDLYMKETNLVKIFKYGLKRVEDEELIKEARPNAFRPLLNSTRIKELLHVPKEVKFLQFNQDMFSTTDKSVIHQRAGVKSDFLNLIEQDIRVLLLQGSADLRCNIVGGDWFVTDLNRELISDFEPWYVDGKIGGFEKKLDGLTLKTILGAGHMIPYHKLKQYQVALNEFFEYVIENPRKI